MKISRIACLILMALPLRMAAGKAPSAPRSPAPGPSRKAEKGCVWKKLSDRTVGLEAWVQRCDFGFRKIDLFFKDGALVRRFSDGGEPDRLVEVFDLLSGESAEAGMKRIFAAKTDKALAARCVLATDRETKPPAGVKRFSFVPDAAFEKELAAKADPNEVPDPPCGEWGEAPDGIQYFELRPASGVRKFLFVRVGQDVPLFDDRTLRPLPAP